MRILVARLLILALSGVAIALGLPREWVDPLISDPEVAHMVSAGLMAFPGLLLDFWPAFAAVGASLLLWLRSRRRRRERREQ